MAKWCGIGQEPGKKGMFFVKKFLQTAVPYPDFFSLEIFPPNDVTMLLGAALKMLWNKVRITINIWIF